MRRAQWEIEDWNSTPQCLVIRDVGDHSICKTITNDVESVVELLVAQGHLPLGRRLMYYDSEGAFDEIVVQNGRFAGFIPGPMRGPR